MIILTDHFRKLPMIIQKICEMPGRMFGQDLLRNVESAVVNIANLYFWWNQAPIERRVRYMEVVEGRKAVLEMNIPVLNTNRARHSRPTLAPNSQRTPL